MDDKEIERRTLKLKKSNRVLKVMDWNFLDWSESGDPRTKQQALENAVKYLKIKILTKDFIKNNKITEENPPTWNILRQEGHMDFLKAAQRRDLTWNNILRTAEFIPHREIDKWDFLVWFTEKEREVALKKATEYFLDKIISKYFRNANNENPPTVKDLFNNNQFDFARALANNLLTYNEVLIRAGFKPHLEHGKWAFLNWTTEAERAIALEKAARYFLDEIIKKKFHQITSDNPPSEQHPEINSFHLALIYHGFTYNEILRYAGFKPQHEPGKWAFLYWTNLKERQRALEQAAKFLLDTILTEEFRNNIEFPEPFAPTAQCLIENGFGFFIGILKSYELNYYDVVNTANLIPVDIDQITKISVYYHLIAQFIFLYHTRRNGCQSFYETRVNSYDERDKYRYNRCDNTILIDFNFLELINKNFIELFKTLNILNIEYFVGSSIQKAKGKSYKGYQDKNKFLIIIPTYLRTPISTPLDVPDRDHVLILDPQSFAKLMNYTGELYDIFIESGNLT